MSVTEETDVVVNSMVYYICISEDEQTVALNDKVESWDWLCL